MTISATQVRKTFTGDGSTTAFTYNYRFLANADLKVYQEGTLKTITTHYTVTGAGNAGGGTVTFLTAPALNDEIVILNDPSNTQSLDLVDNDIFPAESLEAVLDRLTLQIQRCRDLLGRSLVLSDTDLSGASVTLPAPTASNLLAWNLAGTALENVDPDNLGSLTIGTGGITLAMLAAGILTADAAGRAKMADGYVTAAKLADTLDLSAKTLTLPAANTPIMTASYTSTNQTISDGGVLTLTHALGSAPKFMRYSIICTSDDSGVEYVTGDALEVSPVNEFGGGFGFTVRPTSTTIIVTFDGPSVFKVKKKTTAGAANIDLTKWALVVRAWA